MIYLIPSKMICLKCEQFNPFGIEREKYQTQVTVLEYSIGHTKYFRKPFVARLACWGVEGLGSRGCSLRS